MFLSLGGPLRTQLTRMVTAMMGLVSERCLLGWVYAVRARELMLAASTPQRDLISLV